MLLLFFCTWLLCLDTISSQQLLAKYQREMLDAHNVYRKRHCAPALRLDDRLSRSAQNYAEKLARMNTMVHSGITGLGENLYVRRSSRKIDQMNG